MQTDTNTPAQTRAPNDLYARKERVYQFAEWLRKAPASIVRVSDIQHALDELFHPDLQQTWNKRNTCIVLRSLSDFYLRYVKHEPQSEKEMQTIFRKVLSSERTATFLSHRLDDANIRDCCDVIAIFGTISVQPPQKVFEKLQQLISTRPASEMKGRDIAEIMWAHSRICQMPYDETLHAINKALPTVIPTLNNSHDITNILYSYARLGMTPDQHIADLFQQQIKSTFPEKGTPQDIASSMWAFAVFGLIEKNIDQYANIAQFLNGLSTFSNLSSLPLRQHRQEAHLLFGFPTDPTQDLILSNDAPNISTQSLQAAFTQAGCYLKPKSTRLKQINQTVHVAFTQNGLNFGVLYDHESSCVTLQDGSRTYGGAVQLQHFLLSTRLAGTQIVRVMPAPIHALPEVPSLVLNHFQDISRPQAPIVVLPTPDDQALQIKPYAKLMLHRA